MEKLGGNGNALSDFPTVGRLATSKPACHFSFFGHPALHAHSLCQTLSGCFCVRPHALALLSTRDIFSCIHRSVRSQGKASSMAVSSIPACHPSDMPRSMFPIGAGAVSNHQRYLQLVLFLHGSGLQLQGMLEVPDRACRACRVT